MSNEIDTLKYEMRPFVKRSVSTGPGNVGGTTLVDTTLVEPNDFWNGCWLLLRTGTYAGQLRRVSDYDLVTNTITLDHTVGGQIVAAVQYVMMVKEPGRDPSNPLHVLDPGTHTNPRRYEKQYGFVSARVAVAAGPAAAPLWAVGVAAVNPAGGRTAGLVTTVYTLEIENSTGAAVTVWLEDGVGNPISIIYHVANNDTIVIDFVAGKNFGDTDIYINASVAAVIAQISGTEE